MAQVYRQGDWVRAHAFGGKELVRRVAAVENGTVYVCTPDEFEASMREGRDAVAVGFKTPDLSPTVGTR
jgi:hypothetical protein